MVHEERPPSIRLKLGAESLLGILDDLDQIQSRHLWYAEDSLL